MHRENAMNAETHYTTLMTMKELRERMDAALAYFGLKKEQENEVRVWGNNGNLIFEVNATSYICEYLPEMPENRGDMVEDIKTTPAE